MDVLKPDFNPLGEFKPVWIEKQIDEEGIRYLENFGYFLCDKQSQDARFPGPNALTTVQMRNIFGELKRIEANITFPIALNENRLSPQEAFEAQKTAILLLRPKLAYNTARQLEKRRDSRIRQFREVLEKALTHVHDRDQYKRFCQFVEGIVAYHKVYGGRDNSNR